MTIEIGFMWFSLAMLITAGLINRNAMQLLDEAKAQADLWGSRRDEAESLSREAVIMFDNAQRMRAAGDSDR